MKRLAPFLAGAAFLAMACPSKAQTAAEALVTRPATAQVAMIAEVIEANTGEPAELRGVWGYALSRDALIYCGYRRDAGYRQSGFAIVMDGVERDTVVANMTADSLREVGCAQPNFKPLLGTLLPSNPLGGVNLDGPSPRPQPSTRRTYRFPVERAGDPACVAGSQMAYRAVVLDQTEVLDGVPAEALQDTNDLFGLCFNAAGQQFAETRLAGIMSDAQAVSDLMTARQLLQEARSAATRLRMRGY